MRYFRYRHYERLRYSTKFRKWLVAQAARLGMTPKVVFDTLLVKGKMTMDQVAKYTKPVVETRNIAFQGDSRAQFSYTNPGGVNSFFRNVGVASWIQAITAGVLAMPISLNAGVQSETTANILARVPAHITQMQAQGSTRVVFIGGTNDRPGFTVDQTMTNIKAIIKLYTDANISFDLISELPRGTGSSQYELTAQGKADHYAVHLAMEALRGTMPMLTVHNVWDSWVDTASGTNYYVKNGALNAVTQDGIHPSKVGAYSWASISAPLLMAETGLTQTFLPTTTALYDAVAAANGSLTANPLMTGVAGTKTSAAAGITGAFVPTGFKLDASNIAGLTIACSQIQLGGFTYTKLDFSGTLTNAGTNPLVTLQQDVPMTNIAIGDKIKGVAGVAFTGAGLSNVGINLLLTNQYQQVYDTEDSVTTMPYPNLATVVKYSRETPIYTHASPTVGITLRMEAQLLDKASLTTTGQTIACSVYFGQAKVFKV